ncbi:MerC domain-containing protein [Rhodopirellula bahusiensis]|uniref:MerC domain-containing protein n=2 Tax=Rhodopirellula bahusiensis TaxID=2014065 RepID=UPI0032647443
MSDVPYQPASALPLSSPEPETVSTWRDWIGIVASIGCAIHCAAMPFVIAFLPALGLSFLADESFHQWMALACFLFAIAAFVPGFRKHRQKTRAFKPSSHPSPSGSHHWAEFCWSVPTC